MTQVLIEYRPALFFPPRSGPWIIGKITFLPGVKSYPLSEWEALKENKQLASVLEDAISGSILRVISQSTTTTETPPLPKSQQEAIALVNKTYSLSLLRQWQETEKRKPITDAIALQLKKGEEQQPIEKRVDILLPLDSKKEADS
jgi:hypothetical protein